MTEFRCQSDRIGFSVVKAVMTMYEKARTMVKTKHENSEEFEVKVGPLGYIRDRF